MATEKDNKYTEIFHGGVILPNESPAYLTLQQNEGRHNSLLLIAASLILLILLFTAISTARNHEDTKIFQGGVILPNESPAYLTLQQNEGRYNEEKRVFIKIKDNKSDKKIRAQSTSNVQDRVKDKVGRNRIKHDLGNYISASINEKDLEILKKDPSIEVYLVPILKTMLQTSPSIINATPTYLLQESSLNLTGQGQTICVIDTGINYSHPALAGCYGNNNASSACKVIGGWDYCADNTACNTEDSIPEDVAGHGTHVAGIIGANGSINGVAPDSKIAMVKVCNSTGDCLGDKLIAGIDWCVNNRSLFNISAISISLGGGGYADYCDAEEWWYADSINSAVGNGIPVVIATGNDASSTQISATACIRNATAVGATTKNDAVALYSN